jgi:RNA polymerase sigma factor (TIGR02999 family)
MPPPTQATVTRLLTSLQAGNREVFNELFPLVYDTLREQAHQLRKRWHADHTLNTTALVHEAYLKLVDQTQAGWESRAHFLAVAAKAMRHILVDYARRRRSEKRGGDREKLSLDEVEAMLGRQMTLTDDRLATILSLEEALTALARVSEREARVVECRAFGAMSVEETAAALGISTRTVKRDWAMAQAWLYRTLKEES